MRESSNECAAPTFPIMSQYNHAKRRYIDGRTIPLSLIAPHERQALRNHCGQNLSDLARRGGLSVDEAVAVLEDRDWHEMDLDAAVERLKQHVRQHEAKRILRCGDV